jgi:chromosome segregation ATPase
MAISELQDELVAVKSATYCAYCGETFSMDTVNNDQIEQHIKICPAHPIRIIERERDSFQEKLKLAEQALLDSQCEKTRIKLELKILKQDQNTLFTQLEEWKTSNAELSFAREQADKRICELSVVDAASTVALQLAKEALQHDTSDCWATGPNINNSVEDYVVCPGCRALQAIDKALSISPLKAKEMVRILIDALKETLKIDPTDPRSANTLAAILIAKTAAKDALARYRGGAGNV